MKIEMGKEYQTRDGRKVRILCVDGPNDVYPVVGFIESSGPQTWAPDGAFRVSAGARGCDQDLVPVPVTNTVYVNVYRGTTPTFGGTYPSRAECDQAGTSSGRVACVKVTYTEGQFDE